MKIMQNATSYLSGVPRIEAIDYDHINDSDVLLLPQGIEVSAFEDSNVVLTDYDTSRDPKAKDMLRIIRVRDAFGVRYDDLNIISPSVYVHSQEDKPWHITTQCLVVTRPDEAVLKYISKENLRTKTAYGKHELDMLWLPCSKPLNEVSGSDLVCIFNRRISGWDGSPERPVVELLGAGGHLQAVWDDSQQRFLSRDLKDNLKKEFDEEIGFAIASEDIDMIGGFTNEKTHELVVFFCAFVSAEHIPKLQKKALGNFEEDTDGIYLGTFEETMRYYLEKPEHFAGGASAVRTNFPANSKIMDEIRARYRT